MWRIAGVSCHPICSTEGSDRPKVKCGREGGTNVPPDHKLRSCTKQHTNHAA